MADANELPEVVPTTEEPIVEIAEEGALEPKKSLREDLKSTLKEIKERNGQDEPTKEVKPAPKKVISAEPKSITAIKEPLAPKEPAAPKIPAPVSWKAETRAEWDKIPRKLQEEVIRREAEIDKKLSQVDEERQFGRKLKDVVNPYMPLINSANSTPEKAVQEMLNYAHILQTGTPSSKAQLLWSLAQRWGADMRITPQTAQQPAHQLQALTQELGTLKQQLAKQPEMFKQQQEEAKLKSVIEAFASDPKHPHYEKVRPVMASLLTSGVAENMDDAYERACYADPEIRSSLAKEADAKRVAEKKAKADAARNAASSIKGSAAINGAGTIQTPKRSLREELQANFRSATEH